MTIGVTYFEMWDREDLTGCCGFSGPRLKEIKFFQCFPRLAIKSGVVGISPFLAFLLHTLVILIASKVWLNWATLTCDDIVYPTKVL